MATLRSSSTKCDQRSKLICLDMSLSFSRDYPLSLINDTRIKTCRFEIIRPCVLTQQLLSFQCFYVTNLHNSSTSNTLSVIYADICRRVQTFAERMKISKIFANCTVNEKLNFITQLTAYSLKTLEGIYVPSRITF